MLKDMGEGEGEQRREETREWVLEEALAGPPLGRSTQVSTGNMDSLVTSASDTPMTL